MLSADARARRDEANQRETRAWHSIQNRADWERYRAVRLQKLQESLGTFPPVPRELKARVTGQVEGKYYRIKNLVFESRPGLAVTANLYLPAHKPARTMPGMLIIHSHHNPKSQGELQDMGMLWARAGCAALIIDQLGHGERRQHPFVDSKSYPHSFRVSRQDYYFRYNEGMQLNLIGDGLIGWMVWDMMRALDLLLAEPGVDPQRIILLGAVAAGGDPCAIMAALDPRVTAAVPFNFGGPQPETTLPLPAEVDMRFNYAGGGSWESTRNLRMSARDGFLPWVIVGGIAPRGLIYAHEFAWDQEHDPVWDRLQKIYGFYDSRVHLSSTHGRGSVKGQPPESTHCNNIGPEHRKLIYPAFKRWFDIPEPAAEVQERRSTEELTCMTPAALKEFFPEPLYEVAGKVGKERAEAARAKLKDLEPAAKKQRLRQEWRRMLGVVEPAQAPKVLAQGSTRLGEITVERVLLEVESRIQVPAILLLPRRQDKTRVPIVIGIAQAGKQAFLKTRADALAELLTNQVAVCLPDLRGTGETRPGNGRDRNSSATAISSTELMLGQTLVGSRLRDLRSVLMYLRSRPDLDTGRVTLWGDSFAPPNPENRRLDVPLDAEMLPDQSEPLGGLIALLGGIFEDDVQTIYVHGGLVSFQSVLQSPFCYFPHDVVIPGALTAGDLCDLTGALAPRPLKMEGLRDGLNRTVQPERALEEYEAARAAYGPGTEFVLRLERSSGKELAHWFVAMSRRS